MEGQFCDEEMIARWWVAGANWEKDDAVCSDRKFVGMKSENLWD